jgi:hypothetical protein
VRRARLGGDSAHNTVDYYESEESPDAGEPVTLRTCFVQENFVKRDNLQREKVSQRDNFPCYLT